jgi:DNA-directed RNA polymerase subunit RPC12/RpoP
MKPVWRDAEQPLAARLAALRQFASSRGRIKEIAAWLERPDAADVLAAIVAETVTGPGADEEEASGEETGTKRLLKRFLARDADAQVRTSPIARDEGFRCVHCGREVPPHGRTARDHCPHCLHGLHVDVVPGDRASDCHGLLVPHAAEVRGDDVRLQYRCQRCGADRVNRAVRDGSPPDDWAAVVRVASRGG